MLSNATNHGSSVVVTIADKINLAIGDYYLNIIFLFMEDGYSWMMRKL
ncbi:MAG: hypothetical protein RLZZ143_2995, partial [Cyanobacteriota bacterium]